MCVGCVRSGCSVTGQKYKFEGLNGQLQLVDGEWIIKDQIKILNADLTANTVSHLRMKIADDCISEDCCKAAMCFKVSASSHFFRHSVRLRR